MEELSERLGRAEFITMKPFGRSLTDALRNARIRKDGVAVWEEEDYCGPPLVQEREAVLGGYFGNICVEPVREGGDGRRSRRCRASSRSSRPR